MSLPRFDTAPAEKAAAESPWAGGSWTGSAARSPRYDDGRGRLALQLLDLLESVVDCLLGAMFELL